MKKTTTQDLPANWQSQLKKGFYAQVEADGTVRHYGWYRDGDESDQMTVSIDWDELTQEIFCLERYEFAIDPQDEQPPETQFERWVRSWIRRLKLISRGCSFCGHSGDDGREMRHSTVASRRDAAICGPCLRKLSETA